MTSARNTRYADLDSTLQKSYRRLACSPGPYISTGAAAAILQVNPKQTEAALTALRRAHMVDHHGEDRWSLPAPEHARQMADEADTPADREATTARAIMHYLRWTASLEMLTAPTRRRYAAVFAWTPALPPAVESEQEALTALSAWVDIAVAAQAAATAQALHHLAWQFADTLWGYLIRAQDHATAHHVIQVALDSAGLAGDCGALARIHSLAGALARRAGRHDEARDHHDNTAHLAHQSGDTLLEASAAEQQGADLIELGQPHQALKVLRHGLALYRAQPEPHERGEMLLRRQLGKALSLTGHHDQGHQHLAEAAQFFADAGEPYLSSRIAANLAELAADQERYADALHHLDSAIAHCPDTALPHRAYLLYLYATTYLKVDRVEEARTRRDELAQIAAAVPRDHAAHRLLRELEDELLERQQSRAADAQPSP
ncbi:hypothetical protein ACFY4C_37390 [Actinomadura viridis]|uniref:hypothetical protein n=1 Tax=Actinomadura viridis TaxID=58110 RepID=UPI003693C32D